MQDWNNYRDSLLQRVGEYAQLAPDVMKAIGSLEPSIGKM